MSNQLSLTETEKPEITEQLKPLSPDICLVVLGKPKQQPRHRHYTRGKFTGTYDPAQKDKFNFLLTVQNNAPKKPFDEPLRVDIDCYFSRPKCHYGTGKNRGIIKKSSPRFHTVKPDIDNLRKFVMDALNKVFWRDDSIICEGTTRKFYSEKPRTEIKIYRNGE